MSFTPAELEEVFRLMDRDNSGEVSTAELADLLGTVWKDKEKAKDVAKFLVEVLDRDNSGSLSKDEFVRGMKIVMEKY